MGVFARLSDLLKANINDLIDKAEDPEKMVKQIILDMNKELNKAIQNLGKAKASEKIAEKKYLDAEATSKNWESKAKMALQKGDQDLAKKALAKKVKADEELASYKQMYESISAQTNTIGEQVEILKTKLEEAKSRQAMLIARSQMAQTKRQLAAAQSNFDSSSAFAKLDRMEEKVMQQEAEADAYTEITGGNDQDELSEQFAQMENDAQVDAELQRLMSEMGINEAPAQETEAPQDAE
ncbi:MAG: PspA/IM30 family protein [Ruminococcus sp.]|jgi:phage shock protein A|nr:PspA/IM30 family protein [Ruminococcus sp.]MCR5075981.1 PspA/IM30 family protein [Ruminococcus sp.]